MPPSPRRDWRTLIAAVVAAVLAGLTLTVTLVDSDGDGRPDSGTVRVERAAPSVPASVKVDGPDADGKLDDRLAVDPAAARAVERDLEAGQAELANPLREDNDSPATTTVPGPLAADEIPGCRTRFVGNSSSRRGVRPSLIFLHQTVSRERGWASQDALTGLASRPSSGVSWHILIGRSGGRCTYTVPLALKAWTQANANPYAVGIEVEAFGDEGAYVTGAGKAKLVSVVRHIARRYGIPLRRGKIDPNTCRPILSGVVEHSDARACGGGHIDVTLQPGDAAAAIAAAAAAAGSSSSSRTLSANDPRRYRLSVLTPAERRWSLCLLEERRSSARAGGWGKLKPVHLARARGCKGALLGRNEWFHAKGLTTAAARAARHRVIHDVV